MRFKTVINVNGTPEVTTVWMNHEFIRDFCGTMRGYTSMFSQEELEESPVDVDREIRLHWLPVAASKVVTHYLLAPMGVDSVDARKEVKKYLISLFSYLAKEYPEILQSSNWKKKECINRVYEEVFFGHSATLSQTPNVSKELHPLRWNTMVAMATRLQLTIDAIIASDKYMLCEHAYKIQKSGNAMDAKIGALIINLASDSYAEDFNPIPEGFKESGAFESTTPGTDYNNLVTWNRLIGVND